MRFKHYSHIVFVLILAASFSAVGVHAQTEESKANNSLKDGAWALQFQIGSNFTLNSFQGAVISAKRHYSDCIAVRVGVSGSLEFGNSKYNLSDTTRTMALGENSFNTQSISLVGQYLVYPSPDARINVFFGGGPVFTFSRRYNDSKSISLEHYQVFISKGWGVGGVGVFGVEWFASMEFSLHAEYDVSLQYFWDRGSSEYRLTQGDRVLQTQENTSKSWRFYANSVKFGLSVYF